MALYAKRLQSLDDLEREKARLKSQLAALDSQPMIAEESLPWNQLKDFASNGMVSKLLAFVPIASSPILQTVIGMVKRKFFNTEQAPPSARTAKRPAKQEKKEEEDNIFLSVALDIAKGYLAWKAIQLSYKGVRYLLSRRSNAQDTL